ncbi:Smr/MutS family protein [Geoalkalibacter subterraneus]|jgi:DNA-nicking Smr family endonuclease|uniref:Smr/MutS family protein n=1 Tax=Geoalkalibacter subterraneus TaxID=483547 RepID=UPI0006933F84|nr:Smr/MutS family protein [Geoalkalibacter subterraneus]
MSRKKKQAGNAGQKTFKNSPFSALKGCNLADDKGPGPAAGKPAPADPPPGRAPSEGLDFLEEMVSLGVKPFKKGCRVASTPDQSDGINDRVVEDGAVQQPKDDHSLFLEAVGQMDATFSDELPPEEPARALPRRMRDLVRGRLTPGAEIDLHGLDREQARQRVAYFLDNCVYQDVRVALLITGRGRGSGSEPVLRSEMERFLDDDGRKWVAEWGRAPQRYGGEGALVVFLRKK